MLNYFKTRFYKLIERQMETGHLCYKCYFLAINFIFFLMLQGRFQAGMVKGLLLIMSLNAGIGIYHYFSFDQLNKLVQRLSFLLDICFASLLIQYSGGLQSPFILAYAILLVRIGIKLETFWEVIVVGVIGHLIYGGMLYLYYGDLAFYYNFEFYYTIRFWLQSILLAGIFANVVIFTQIINKQNSKLKEAKEEAEALADDLTQVNEKLRKRSITDLVTGLYNFRYFNQELKKKLKQAKQGKIKLGLIKIDLDDFKEYNRCMGTQTGDKALYRVGQILKRVVPQDCIVTRLGSDEFAIILGDTKENKNKEISERIRNAIHQYSFEGEENLAGGTLTASLGLAMYSDEIDCGEELINKADEALYRVKLSHKNGIRFYSSMFADLKNEFEDSDPVLINTLRTLLTVINARDRYTYGHSERVVKYAMAVGEEIGLSEERMKILKYAAFLHDIGKIEINRDILNKKGRLTSGEWNLIRKHTIFGVNIVEPMNNLEDIIPVVMHHHERYDGEGYPGGLAAEEIPFLARILTVVDSFDAMTTNRPYRGAMTCKEAIEELKEEKGKQFDPQVVDAFIEVANGVYEDIKRCAS